MKFTLFATRRNYSPMVIASGAKQSILAWMPAFAGMTIVGEIIALIAGVLLVLAFAPFNFWPLAILSPALLLAVWLPASPRRAFLRGWLFGLGMFGTGIYWVYISLRVYGYSSPFFATLVTVLLIAALALYFAMQGYLLQRFFPKNHWIKLIVVFPALWTIVEWIRSWLFTGFPWLSLGYTQINSVMRGFAPLIGVYGISFLITLTSALLIATFYFISVPVNIERESLRDGMLLEGRTAIFPSNRKREFTSRAALISGSSSHFFGNCWKPWRWRITCLLSIFILWIFAALLAQIHWTQPLPQKIKVSLLQGNIPQEQKWQAGQIENILSTYLQLMKNHLDSDLIIWPECAIVIPNVNARDFLQALDQAAKEHNTTIISGIPIYENFRYYNAVMVLGHGSGTYMKRHLLPFGDYIPLRFIFDIFNRYVQIPMSDFAHGATKQKVLMAKNIPIAAFICYEIVFPEEVIQSLPQAQLLLLVTDDSWFGDSIAAAQHLQMAQMRAVETGRYLLFDSNSGITAIINPQGKLIATAPVFKTDTLSGTVQPMTGSTPFIITGNYLILLLCLGFLSVGWWRRKK